MTRGTTRRHGATYGLPTRPTPGLEAHEVDELAAWARGKTDLRAIAREYGDEGDPAVFAAVVAGQRVDGEPWLVRGVLRRDEPGPPLLRRITVEHLTDPAREVTGAVLRRLNIAAIRDGALARLQIRGATRGRLAASGLLNPAIAEAAQRAARQAAAGRRGPRNAYPAGHYRYIAIRYLELVAQGRKDVVNALCEEVSGFGEQIEHERMREWIRKATKLGYLSPGRQGTPKREPGPNLNKEENDG